MFCGKCGTRNPDDDSYCSQCGAPLRRQGAQVNTPPAPAYAPTYAPPVTALPTDAWHQRVRTVLDEYFTGPLFLVTIVLYTLIQILNLVMSQSGGMLDTVYSALESAGMSSSDVRGIMGDVWMVNNGVSLIFAIPGLLMCAGMWMVYGSAAGGSSRGVRPGGLTMIRVIQIIAVSLWGIIMVLLLFSLINLSGSVSNYSSSAGNAVSMVILIVFIVIAVVAVYYGTMISTLAKVEDTIRSKVPDSGVSMTLAVFLFFSGGFSVLGWFGSGITLVGFLQSAVTILWGVGICTYRSKMQELEVEAYSYRKASISSGAPYANPHANLPAWKRVQVEQGLDD